MEIVAKIAAIIIIAAPTLCSANVPDKGITWSKGLTADMLLGRVKENPRCISDLDRWGTVLVIRNLDKEVIFSKSLLSKVTEEEVNTININCFY